jgi:NCS2 family nucleobase:cation symporter-2
MKPSSIQFGVDEQPPLSLALGSALQHWMLGLASLAFPLLVIDEAKRLGLIHADQVHTMLMVSYLALGFSTLLQALRGRFIGAGYLIPTVYTAAFLPANLAALQVGGLGLVFGMTIFAGLFEIVLAYVVRRFPQLFPAEVSGIIVLLVGLVLGMIGMRLMFSLSPAGEPSSATPYSSLLAGVTMAVSVTLAVWFKGTLRALSVMIGMVIGTLVSVLLSDGSIASLMSTRQTGSFIWPVATPSFNVDLIFPYATAALVCALRAIGDITIAQRINDTGWKRPDQPSIGRGVVADGLGNVSAGVLGTVGLNTFSGSVGLSLATGITARRVGFVLAAVYAAAAFTPGIATLATLIPRPVLGAAMLLSACFILTNAMQAIVSQALDNRKILVVSMAFFFGLSRHFYPGLYEGLPGWLRQLLDSELTVGVIVLLCLVPLFRLGATRRQQTRLSLDGSQHEALFQFVHDSAASLGARADSVHRAVMAATEFIELAPSVVDPGTPITLSSSYDDFTLRILIHYAGQPLERPDKSVLPNVQDIEDSEDSEEALRRFGVSLMTRMSDEIKITHSGRDCSVQLSFR